MDRSPPSAPRPSTGRARQDHPPTPGRRRRGCLEHATSFLQLCADQRLPVPDHDFQTILHRAGTHLPDMLSPSEQEENCAALLWASAYLEAGQPENDWDYLSNALQNILLSLYHPLPQQSSDPHASIWKRLAAALRRHSTYNCWPPTIDVDPPDPPPCVPPLAPTRTPISTARPSSAPAPLPPPALPAPPLPSPAPPPPPIPAGHWAFLAQTPPSVVVPAGTIPQVLHNTMDPYSHLNPSQRKKLLEAIEKPGCTNDQTKPAACYLASFLLSNGEALNAVLRGLVVGMGCRSELLDDSGLAVPGEKDPHGVDYETNMLRYAKIYNEIPWTNGALPYATIVQLRKMVCFCYHRALTHSASYYCDHIQRNVKRMCEEIPRFLEGAVDKISTSHQSDPAHLQWWNSNKDIFAQYYPCIAEHILGKSGITEDAIRAEISSVFAVPPMANARPHWPTLPPPLPAPVAPPPPHLPPPPLPPPSMPPPQPHAAPSSSLPQASGSGTAQPPGSRRRVGPPWPSSRSGGRFTARPCSPAIVGDDIGIPMPSVPTTCMCAASSLAGMHRSWECPLAFFAKFRSCPGFLPTGAKDPAAWHSSGTALLPATRALWQTFIATHALAKARDALGDVTF